MSAPPSNQPRVPIRLGISGTARFTDQARFTTVLDFFLQTARTSGAVIAEVRTGDSSPADEWARSWAKAQGFPEPAKERDPAALIRASDHLILFLGPQSAEGDRLLELCTQQQKKPGVVR